MATVLRPPEAVNDFSHGRDSVEFRLSNTLSIKLVKINQKRSYIYPSTGNRIRYQAIKYKLDDIPRPNHGFNLDQLEEITNNLVRLVTLERMKEKVLTQAK